MKQIKWFLQRVFRGYDDRIYWELYSYLSEIIAKHLKHFRKMKRTGYPTTLKSEKEWNKVLDKMIWSFENSSDDIIFPIDDRAKTSKQLKKLFDKQKEGLQLFAKHFYNLWD